jgi:hypothetical protein
MPGEGQSAIAHESGGSQPQQLLAAPLQEGQGSFPNRIRRRRLALNAHRERHQEGQLP